MSFRTKATLLLTGVIVAGPALAQIGGVANGISPQFARCINETTGASVSIPATGVWNCNSAGLATAPGDSILQLAIGTPIGGGAIISGAIVGLDGIFGACRNFSTGQIVPIPLSGGSSWDCTTAGFTAAAGEFVAIISRGTIAAAAPTYIADVQPIFESKCSPCHTTLGFGGHNIGTDYLDAFQAANNSDCTGLNVGQCTIVRIQSGDMPQGAGCSGDPVLDAGNPSCLTQSEQDTLQAWIDAGLPE